MEEWELIGWLWAENAGSRRFFVMSKAISCDILRTAATQDLGQRNAGLYSSFNIWTSEMVFMHACRFAGLCKCFQQVLKNTYLTLVIAEALGYTKSPQTYKLKGWC